LAVATWTSGSPITIELSDAPELNFQIPTRIPGFEFSAVEPRIKSLHRESMWEMLLRIPDIFFFSGKFRSEFAGELNMVLDRGNESNDINYS
jgi:hypothetical protein